MTTTETEPIYKCDNDVVIVGGGSAGCSAGVFCSREGLDTVVFDRRRSSLKRRAHLENHLGFPDGIDIETFYDLMHDHTEAAGCDIVPDLVESVDLSDDEAGFRITPQEGESVTARRVVAATRYDGGYMRDLHDDASMFETHEYDSEEHEHFDKGYAAADGTTPVDRLYVVTPSDEDDRAIITAGRGTRVARRVIDDTRQDVGWWEEVSDGVDWVRREAELDDEWADRDRWVEWFDDYYGEDAPVETDSDRFQRVREADIDNSLSSYISSDELADRAAAGREALTTHLGVERLLGAVDAETLLDHVDDDVIRERASELNATEVDS
jgi:hypothetical protein